MSRRRSGKIAAFGLSLSLAYVVGHQLTVLMPTAGAADLKADVQALLKTFQSEFVEIIPGKDPFPATFQMGSQGDKDPKSEMPAHNVTFKTGFAIAKYEVPQNLYEAIMGNNPSRWKGPRNSAENFSWADANRFCAKATQLMREAKLIKEDEVIRLPSEAEWEYCCRAGTTTQYSFGNSATAPGDKGNKASVLDKYGWNTGNAAGNDPPVGALKPNPWGLYDMHGYLSEFVSDAWHDSYSGAPADGRSWQSDKADPQRIVRGGSWKDRYELHRSAARVPVEAEFISDGVGFRCVKSRSAP